MNKVRPFKEYKEMIQDMPKEEMIKGLYHLSKNNIEKEQEIERLNNIIEETRKYVKSLSDKGRGCEIYADIKHDILNKLQGSDSNE